MAEEMEYGIVEWIIENFSCWNQNVHSEVMSYEFGVTLGISLTIQLRPKGREERLLASVLCTCEPVAYLSAFSIIGPDGSNLGGIEPEGDNELYNVNLVGPKFDDVVAHIRRHEALHQDTITLKLAMRWKYGAFVVARTEIATTRASWTTHSGILRSLDPGFNWIAKTYYPVDDSVGEMDLVVLKNGSEIKLRLDHESSFRKNVLVFVNVTVVGRDGAVKVVATEEKERMFRELESWIFWNYSLTKETMEFTLTLRVKIVPSVGFKPLSGYHMPIYLSRHCKVTTSCHESQN